MNKIAEFINAQTKGVGSFLEREACGCQYNNATGEVVEWCHKCDGLRLYGDTLGAGLHEMMMDKIEQEVKESIAMFYNPITDKYVAVIPPVAKDGVNYCRCCGGSVKCVGELGVRGICLDCISEYSKPEYHRDRDDEEEMGNEDEGEK